MLEKLKEIQEKIKMGYMDIKEASFIFDMDEIFNMTVTCICKYKYATLIEKKFNINLSEKDIESVCSNYKIKEAWISYNDGSWLSWEIIGYHNGDDQYGWVYHKKPSLKK